MKPFLFQSRRASCLTIAALAIVLLIVIRTRPGEPPEHTQHAPVSMEPVHATLPIALVVRPVAGPIVVETPSSVIESGASDLPARRVPQVAVAAPGARTVEELTELDIAEAHEKRRKARRNVLRIYGPYLSQAKLTSEEAAKLKDLLVLEMETPSIVNDSLRAMGIDTESPAAAQAMLTALAETQREVKQLLGEEEYLKMGEIARAVRFSDAIEKELQPNLYAARLPLSEAQFATFAERLGQFTRWDNPAFRAALQTPPDPTSGLRQIDLEVLRIAERLLQPEQLTILRTTLEAKRVAERQKNGDREGLRLYKFDL